MSAVYVRNILRDPIPIPADWRARMWRGCDQVLALFVSLTLTQGGLGMGLCSSCPITYRTCLNWRASVVTCASSEKGRHVVIEIGVVKGWAACSEYRYLLLCSRTGSTYNHIVRGVVLPLKDVSRVHIS